MRAGTDDDRLVLGRIETGRKGIGMSEIGHCAAFLRHEAAAIECQPIRQQFQPPFFFSTFP